MDKTANSSAQASVERVMGQLLFQNTVLADQVQMLVAENKQLKEQLQPVPTAEAP